MGFIRKKTNTPSHKDILHALKGIIEAQAVTGLHIDNASGHVIIPVQADPAQAQTLEPLRQKIEKTVMAIPGVHKVTAVLTAETPPPPAAMPSKKASDPHGMNKNPPLNVPAKHIIAVASGKGGVGKSTIAANIAASLTKTHGKKVGLLDADIYGPSQPVMMGGESYKPELNADKKLIPAEKHGIKIMSIGFIADSTKALVWRGPMVQSAFYQMLRDVAWTDEDDTLDYLIIDLPPGTGDVQLTLAQKVPVSGAVIVSTPQDIALIDAKRAVEMFRMTNVPVLGIIENMSTYICPNCGHEEHIFDHGGAEEEAQALGVPFLGAISLSKTIREHSDKGLPSVLAAPGSAQAQQLDDVVQNIIAAQA